MTNPLRLRWLQGWTFQVVLMEGHVQVEAVGFGICLRTAVLPGESPKRQLIVWFYLKIDAGVLYTMPGFAVRTWCSQPGFPPRKRTCRPPILLWLLARPIANGWPDHLMCSSLGQQPGEGKADSSQAQCIPEALP